MVSIFWGLAGSNTLYVNRNTKPTKMLEIFSILKTKSSTTTTAKKKRTIWIISSLSSFCCYAKNVWSFYHMNHHNVRKNITEQTDRYSFLPHEPYLFLCIHRDIAILLHMAYGYKPKWRKNHIFYVENCENVKLHYSSFVWNGSKLDMGSVFFSAYGTHTLYGTILSRVENYWPWVGKLFSFFYIFSTFWCY